MLKNTAYIIAITVKSLEKYKLLIFTIEYSFYNLQDIIGF
jgi:hypothetical protein